MKLYISPGSPYARIVRIVIIEKGLSEKVEVIVAKTRTTGSPYYQINPSGRVPHLVCSDGLGLEDSGLICSYLDHLNGQPRFEVPSGEQGFEAKRLEALVRSTLDGCTLGFADLIPEFSWRPEHPKLNSWFEAISARTSFLETKPPMPK